MFALTFFSIILRPLVSTLTRIKHSTPLIRAPQLLRVILDPLAPAFLACHVHPCVCLALLLRDFVDRRAFLSQLRGEGARLRVGDYDLVGWVDDRGLAGAAAEGGMEDVRTREEGATVRAEYALAYC